MLCTKWASGSGIPGPRGKKLGVALGTHELCLQTVNTLKALSKVRVFSPGCPFSLALSLHIHLLLEFSAHLRQKAVM